MSFWHRLSGSHINYAMSQAIYLSYLHDEKSIRAKLPLGRYWPAFLLPGAAERLAFSRHCTAFGEVEWWLCWHRLPRIARQSQANDSGRLPQPPNLAAHWQEPLLLQAKALGFASQIIEDFGGEEQCRQELQKAGKTYIDGKNLLIYWAMEKVKRQNPRQIQVILPGRCRAAGMLPRALLDWLCRQANSLIFWGYPWPELELWQKQAGYRTGTIIGNRPQAEAEGCREALEKFDQEKAPGVMLLDLTKGRCLAGGENLTYSETAFYIKGEPRRLTPVQAEVLLYCRSPKLWQLLQERPARECQEELLDLATALQRAGCRVG